MYDEKQKTGQRWNLLDWCLLILAALLLLGSLLFLEWRGRDTSEPAEGIALFVIRRVPTELLSEQDEPLVSVGELLRSEQGGSVLGEITEVVLLPHARAVLREGTLSWEMQEGWTDLEIRVRLHGKQKAGQGFSVGDHRLVAGMSGAFRFGNYTASAELVHMEVMK